MIKLLFTLLLTITVSGCSSLATHLAQRNLYPFEQVNERTAFKQNSDAVILDDDSFYAWEFPNHGPLIFYFHGNGMSLTDLDQVGIMSQFNQMGHLFYLEYPGINPAKLQESEEPNMAELGFAAVKLIEAGKFMYPDREVVIIGRSIGAAVAMIAAALTGPDKLILISPFTSMKDAAEASKLSWAFKYVKDDWVKKNEYPSLPLTEVVVADSLVIHGAKDSLIPYTQGAEVHEGLGGYFLLLDERDHNDIFHEPGLFGLINKFIHNALEF